jgi:hypothetical protein
MSLRTEEEARQTACCRTLCADIWSNPSENEGECRTVSTPCIASQCQAWRWAKLRPETYRFRKGLEPTEEAGWKLIGRDPWDPDYAYFVRNTNGPRLGFCGLAGSPS